MGFYCLDFYDFLEYFGYPVFGTQTCRTNLDSLELWSISGWFDSVPDGPTLPGWSESWVHRDAVQRDNMNSFFLGQRLWATHVFSRVQRIHWIHHDPSDSGTESACWTWMFVTQFWVASALYGFCSAHADSMETSGRRSFAAKWRGKVWCLRAYPQISSVPHGWRGLQRFFPGLCNTDGQRLAITFVQTGWHGWRAENKHQVFGGILGNVIENEDGSYGSDDRTSEIRARLSLSKLTRCASRGRPVTWASEHWLDIDTELY